VRETLGVRLVGGAQDLGAPLPLGRGQTVVDVVGGHPAEGAVLVLGVDGKKRWQNAWASSQLPNHAGKSGRNLRVLNYVDYQLTSALRRDAPR
jgi:hypothetical protein